MISEDLERDISREVLMNSYYEFFRWAFAILHPSDPYIDNFHVKYLCDILQEEAERILRREEKHKDILINIPPRTSKSLITSVCYQAWVWIKNPAAKFICISVNEKLAFKNAQLCKDIIKSKAYQDLFGDKYQIRPDRDANGLFENTFGGYRISQTTGQQIIGFSGLFIIVDDPDSTGTVATELGREQVHDFYFGALYTRLTPITLGLRLVVQQRLHEEDLTGIILKKHKNKYIHICLPAELSDQVKPVELREKYVDGLLDPNRLTQLTLIDLKETLGSKEYAGQYEQIPSPAEGGIFKKEWFDIVNPSTIYRDVVNNPIHYFLDTAFTEKTVNDPSALLSCFTKDNCLYVLDVQQVWLEFPKLIQFVISHTAKFGYTSNSKIFIEPKANGLSLLQQLRTSTSLNVIELPTPKDSKVTRANSITAIAESKRVKIIEGVYSENFLNQLIAFPFATHDDMTDVLVYAVQRLLQKSGNPDMAFISLSL